MTTTEIKVYKYDELSDEAKSKARDWYRDATISDGYHWADDAIKSLSELAKHFSGRLKDYGIDFFNGSHSHATFDMPDMNGFEINQRLCQLGKYDGKTLKGVGECKLTGYCADESAIDGFRIEFKGGERDLTALMAAAFDSWLKDAQSDAEYQNSDEQVAETIQANDYGFTAEGKRTVTL